MEDVQALMSKAEHKTSPEIIVEVRTRSHDSKKKPLFCLNATHPRDGRYAWLVCLCGTVSNVIAFGCLYSYGVLYPPLLEEFGQSQATTALLGSLGMSCLYCLSPLAAKLYDRIGPRKLAILGSLFCTLGLGCSSPANSLYIMFFTHGILCGFGACCVQTAVYNIVPRYFKQRASFALGLIVTGPGAGILIFSTINGECLTTIGWRGAYMVMAGTTAFICVPGIFFSSSIDCEEFLNEDEASQRNIVRPGELAFPRLRRNNVFIVFAFLSFLAGISESTILVYVGTYGQYIGLSPYQTDIVYQTMGGFSMTARPLTGFLLDRFQFLTPRRVFRVSTFMVGLSAIVCPLLPTFYTMLAFAGMFGIFYGAVNMTFYAIVFGLASLRQRSTAVGLSTCTSGIGYLAGPPLAGLLVDFFNSYPLVFYLAGGMEVVTFLLTFTLELFKQPGGPISGQIGLIQSTLELYQEKFVVEKLTVL